MITNMSNLIQKEGYKYINYQNLLDINIYVIVIQTNSYESVTFCKGNST